MTDQARPVSRSWRRFLRFSMRGMIVVVLVIGGWLGWVVRSAQIQREAVAAIENAGGAVSYDWGRISGSIPAGGPWAPEWLVNLIGVDYFGHVTEALINQNSTVTDGVIAKVGCLTQLHDLFLHSTCVSDAGLSHLKGLTNLEWLDLGKTQITDAGLVHLRGLANLTELRLGGTQVTDAGLRHLKGLTKLSQLDLSETQVTDAGLRELKRTLPNLKIGLDSIHIYPSWNRPCHIARPSISEK